MKKHKKIMEFSISLGPIKTVGVRGLEGRSEKENKESELLHLPHPPYPLLHTT